MTPDDIQEVKEGEVADEYEDDEEEDDDVAFNLLDDCYDLLRELGGRKRITKYLAKQIQRQVTNLANYLLEIDPDHDANDE